MKYILIVYLLLSDTQAGFIVPQYTFQSQTDCLLTLQLIETDLQGFEHYGECVPFPEERDI
jgi:hypothetical protein